MGKKGQRQNEQRITQATDAQLAENKEWQREQAARLADQKAQYRAFEFTNPFAGMENVFEDLEVSTEAARFQMEQGAQQRANVMAGLQGAAGSSGIAGLAQAMANQGTLQARQVSLDIAQQERQNAMMKAKGAQHIDSMFRQGEAAVQSAEFGRESTLYAAELGEMAGARAGVQSAFANQMAGLGAMADMQSARMGMIGDIVGGVASMFSTPVGSDRKLKKNIKHIFDSPSGIPVYNFEYIDSKHGSGVHQGVMSDEVPIEAVSFNPDGYEMVDYSMIDVEFKKVN